MKEKRLESEDLVAIIIALIIFGAFVLMVAILAANASADGGGSDDNYLIGHDSVNLIHDLYIPIYTEGNNTVVHFEAETVNNGNGNGRWYAEFMDNENLMVKSNGHVYKVVASASSDRPVSQFDFDLTISRDAGWDEGIYWIVVENEYAVIREWCRISYNYSYETDAPGTGGLVQKEVDRVDRRIDNLTLAQQTLAFDLMDLRNHLEAMNELILDLQRQDGALEENDTYLRKYLQELLTTIGEAQKRVEASTDALEADIDALNLSFYLQLHALQDELSNRVALLAAELNYTKERLSTVTSREVDLENELKDLEERIEELEYLLRGAEENITALEGQEYPEDSDAGALVVGLVALGVAGTTAVAMARMEDKRRSKMEAK